MKSFAVFADGTANLPNSMLNGIRLIPLELSIAGKPSCYTGDLDQFDAHKYYESLRQGELVQTSLVNTHAFLEAFEPVLASGEDLVYIVNS